MKTKKKRLVYAGYYEVYFNLIYVYIYVMYVYCKRSSIWFLFVQAHREKYEKQSEQENKKNQRTKKGIK